MLFFSLSAKKSSYLYAWLSYDDDSNNYVYFDDFKVTHTKSNVIQYNEYYPFGLQTSNSWTRADSKNSYLYNGASELNSTTGFYEMFYRGYDPALGRMFQVDPYASEFASLTPYNYAGNNPVLMNDPSGGYMRVNPESGEFAMYEFQPSFNRVSYSGMSSSSMSAQQFIDWALGSEFGGGWSDGEGYLFESDEEAFAAGVAYNFQHNSWGNTYYGTYEATLVGYMASKINGDLLSPEAVNAAIDIVRSKHMYDDRPNLLASTDPGTLDPTYSYGGIDGLSSIELYGLILADKTIEQFGIKDIVALAGILAGQPSIAKRFVTPGSSSGTSPLSKFLSNKLGTSPVRLPTIVANSGRVGIAMTKSLGKFAARGIPIIGWGILAYDATMILYNTQIEYNRITNDD